MLTEGKNPPREALAAAELGQVRFAMQLLGSASPATQLLRCSTGHPAGITRMQSFPLVSMTEGKGGCLTNRTIIAGQTSKLSAIAARTLDWEAQVGA